MTKNSASNSSSADVPIALAQTDRVLLDLLRDGISERSGIRNARAEARARRPEDTKRARLERNQERLEALFEEALTNPAINRALRDRGFDINDLREATDRGVWRELVPVINAIRPPAERLADDQRREAIAQATRAIFETQDDRRLDVGPTWLDALEERARESVPRGELSDKVVARRLVEWTEAALSVVPEPTAASARLALVERAYGGVDDHHEQTLGSALRAVIEGDKSGRYARPSLDEGARDVPAAHRRDVNRIWSGHADENGHGQRQVEELAVASRPAVVPAETGLFTRLRGFLRQTKRDAAVSRDAVGEDDDIPQSLKRRYAIHVSDDRKAIELFEAGAKTAAITLDAKSISTSHDEGAVIADVITLARDRGWQTLKLAGTPAFKDALWLEASKAGLVAQHEPYSAAKAAFAKWDRERPANQIQEAPPARGQEARAGVQDDLARVFASKNPEERLADPRLRNAQLELMIGMRTAEEELKRPIAEMPEVAKALTAAVREQLASGRVFDAPFVEPELARSGPKRAQNPRIEADRIPTPRP